jgi:hypothetical protein
VVQYGDGDGTYTEWRAIGFKVTPGLSDILGFSLRLQSWRSMGTCYVMIPRANQEPFWAGTNHTTIRAPPMHHPMSMDHPAVPLAVD